MAVPADEVRRWGQANQGSLLEVTPEIGQDVIGLNGLPIELASSELLRQADIIGIREGGLVECFVPFDLIDNEEVPVKEEWAASLATQMHEIAEAEGGTGQHSAVTLGFIDGEPTLKIMDGFHRSAGLKQLGEDKVFATVKMTDWDGLYDYRIFTAKDHTHVRFSRVVQWIREVWDRSPLSELQTSKGSELTVTQAIVLYRFDTAGSKLGLDPKDAETVKDWVARKEHLWDIAAMTIHSYLKVAETVDPKLVHSTREQKRGDILDAPTQNILKVFSDVLPDNFGLQNLVMETAKSVKLPNAKGGTRNLNGPEIRALCLKVKDCETIEEGRAVILGIDWRSWEPEYGETKQRALRRAHDPRHQGAAALGKSFKEIASIRERVAQSVERGEPIDPTHEQMIKEARAAAIKLMRELGTLTVELSNLIGEKLPMPRAIVQPKKQESPTNGRQYPDPEASVDDEFDEHQGLLPVLDNRARGRFAPDVVTTDIENYLMGEVDIEDIPHPETPSEKRQFKAALAKLVDTGSAIRPRGWNKRFQELNILANPGSARAYR